MRNFTEADLQPWAGSVGLFASREELVDAQPNWMRQGLQETASGYGGRLNSGRKISFEGKLYRLYVTQYSNAGSVWFKVKGRKVFVN